MPTYLITYGSLGVAIVAEVLGSTFLVKSEGFTRFWPTAATLVFYAIAFYMLSQTVKEMPLGLAYAIWAGLGIVLTAAASVVILKQSLDIWAFVGIALIISGVLVMNLLSHTSGH